ncbi:MAG: DNA gyrase subunit A, partial [Leptospiraceae bacterium]|nr:DNA gyrase subunit A [Leptospiraceae bacterium]
DLIADKQIVISLSTSGYLRALQLDSFKRQKRGGRGVTAQTGRAEDNSSLFLIGRVHQKMLLFSNMGKAYFLNCYEIPITGKDSRGKSARAFLPLAENEEINAITIFDDFNDKDVLCMVTTKGIIKKSKLDDFKNVKKRGIVALNLSEGDSLVDVKLADDGQDIFLASRNGNGLRTSLGKMRAMGRTAAGIIGMRLEEDDQIIGLAIVHKDSSLAIITSNGYGKRTSYDQFNTKGRGGKGMAYLKVSEKIGHCVGIASVGPEEEIIVNTSGGMVVRFAAGTLSEQGRTASGVRVIDLNDEDVVTDFGIVPDEEI